MNWIVGIDIAKDTFEVCMLDTADGVHKATFANTKSGINKLHRWLQQQGAKTVHVCLEATGIYGERLAETLHQQGYLVSVVNPARVKAYAASRMQRNKTDTPDAALIADYCRTQQPPAWKLPSPELEELQALETRIRRRVERKLKARQELITMAVTFFGLTVMFWVVWTFTMPGGFPWPIFPMFGFAIAMGSKLAEYHQEYGAGYEARQRMIQAEIARERFRQMDAYDRSER